MIFGVLSYFLLVTSLLALLFLPSVRARVTKSLQQALSSSQSAAMSLVSGGQSRMSRTAGAVGERATRVGDQVRRNARLLLLALLVLSAALIVPLAFRGWQELDGFDHTASHEVNEQIAALLHGEQLVPPAPLPPQMFLTREVEIVRPSISQASRQWELLDDDFRQRLLVVFKVMRDTHGYDMVLLEGYRSPERQARLAAMGNHVTQAGPFESYHQFGLAADCAFISNGRIVISEADPWAARGYENLGTVAKSVGLTWGGSWRTIKDLGHVELTRPGVLNRAR